jgi:hypothetical protein
MWRAMRRSTRKLTMPSDMPPVAAPATAVRSFRTLSLGAGFFVMLGVLLMLGNLIPKVPAL